MASIPTSTLVASSSKGIEKGKASAQRLTHFICLPLVTGTSRTQLQRSFEWFRNDVLSAGKPVEEKAKSNEKDGGLVPDRPRGDFGGHSSRGLGLSALEISEGAGWSRGDGIETGMPPKSIRPLGSLHLTLGVMSLLTPGDVQRSLEVLQGLDLHHLLQNIDAAPKSNELPIIDPLTVSLKSLTSMHPPHKTSILYANPEDPSGRLLPFCQSLLNVFKEIPKENGESLVVAENRPLLLHATVVNTVYAKGGRGGSNKASRQRGHGKFRGKITFDATNILEKYQDYEWMRDVRIEKVAICRMGAQKVLNGKGEETGDEEYVVEGELDMP